MKTSKTLVISILGLCSAQTALANNPSDQKPPNQSYFLNVSVTNRSNSTCVLTNMVDAAGSIPEPALSHELAQGQKSTFQMKDLWFGNDILMQYDCSGKKITIRTTQSEHFFAAGTITAIVWQADPGINAITTYIKQPSQTWDRPGTVNWDIVNN